MCDEGKEKREVLKTSLFFFFGRISSSPVSWVFSPNEKAPNVSSNDFGILNNKVKGGVQNIEFPEEFLCKLKKKVSHAFE